MATLKPREIEAFIKKPNFAKSIILIYGPDPGLVSERATKLAESSGIDLSDPFSMIRLDADDAASDATKIADEAHTINMFGGKRLIRISGQTRRDLMKSVKPLLDTPSEDSIILIEAGDLAKSSALRKNLEPHPAALCIPCYQDSDSTIEQLIEEEIIGNGLNIDTETRALLKGMLGDNRLISRGELVKLFLYCKDKERVEVDDIHAVVGDAAKLVLDDVVDACATGNIANLQKVLPKAIETGNRPDMIIAAVLRHFQMLQNGRSKIEQNRQAVSSVIGGMRPPVHFSRKSQVSQALSIWSLIRVNRALERLDKAMFEARSDDSLGEALAGTALLALSLEANQLKNR